MPIWVVTWNYVYNPFKMCSFGANKIPVCCSTLINLDRIPGMNILRHRETLSLKVFVSVDIEFFALYIYKKQKFYITPRFSKITKLKSCSCKHCSRYNKKWKKPGLNPLSIFWLEQCRILRILILYPAPELRKSLLHRKHKWK